MKRFAQQSSGTSSADTSYGVQPGAASGGSLVRAVPGVGNVVDLAQQQYQITHTQQINPDLEEALQRDLNRTRAVQALTLLGFNEADAEKKIDEIQTYNFGDYDQIATFLNTIIPYIKKFQLGSGREDRPLELALIILYKFKDYKNSAELIKNTFNKIDDFVKTSKFGTASIFELFYDAILTGNWSKIDALTLLLPLMTIDFTGKTVNNLDLSVLSKGKEIQLDVKKNFVEPTGNKTRFELFRDMYMAMNRFFKQNQVKLDTWDIGLGISYKNHYNDLFRQRSIPANELLRKQAHYDRMYRAQQSEIIESLGRMTPVLPGSSRKEEPLPSGEQQIKMNSSKRKIVIAYKNLRFAQGAADEAQLRRIQNDFKIVQAIEKRLQKEYEVLENYFKTIVSFKTDELGNPVLLTSIVDSSNASAKIAKYKKDYNDCYSKLIAVKTSANSFMTRIRGSLSGLTSSSPPQVVTTVTSMFDTMLAIEEEIKTMVDSFPLEKAPQKEFLEMWEKTVSSLPFFVKNRNEWLNAKTLLKGKTNQIMIETPEIDPRTGLNKRDSSGNILKKRESARIVMNRGYTAALMVVSVLRKWADDFSKGTKENSKLTAKFLNTTSNNIEVEAKDLLNEFMFSSPFQGMIRRQ